MEYISELTSALISSLSIGHSAPETVFFWVKGALMLRLAVIAVDSFL